MRNNFYVSKCEESTIFNKDELKYSCNCPRRTGEMDDKKREEERQKNELVLNGMLNETMRLQNASKPEEEIREILKNV